MKLELKSVHLPSDVAFWPLAPAWWVIIAVIIALIILALIYKGSTLRAHKLKLKQLFVDAEKTFDNLSNIEAPIIMLQQSNQALKRVIISLDELQKNNDSVALIHQAEWLHLLEQRAAPFRFSETTKTMLSDALYQPKVELNSAELINELKQWLKQCRKNHV